MFGHLTFAEKELEGLIGRILMLQPCLEPDIRSEYAITRYLWIKKTGGWMNDSYPDWVGWIQMGDKAREAGMKQSTSLTSARET